MFACFLRGENKIHGGCTVYQQLCCLCNCVWLRAFACAFVCALRAYSCALLCLRLRAYVSVALCMIVRDCARLCIACIVIK